jgi:hypothetical protein
MVREARNETSKFRAFTRWRGRCFSFHCAKRRESRREDKHETKRIPKRGCGCGLRLRVLRFMPILPSIMKTSYSTSTFIAGQKTKDKNKRQKQETKEKGQKTKDKKQKTCLCVGSCAPFLAL